jgi:hypothetical protein
VVAFASLLATDVIAILAFCTVPACLLCNFGIADSDCSGSSTDLTTPKKLTSALPPIANPSRILGHVRFVPIAEVAVIRKSANLY